MQGLLLAGALLFGANLASSTPSVGNGQTTNSIAFGGFPGPYTYRRASSVKYNSGNPTCPIETVSTGNGPLAPLTDESHHIFRGPLNLLQFAVYQGTASSSKHKREVASQAHLQRHRCHAHKKVHRHLRKDQLYRKEEQGELPEVTATIDGQIVNWPMTSLSPASAPVSPVPEPPAPPAPAPSASSLSQPEPEPAPAAGPSSNPSSSGSWSRVSYFNAASQSSDNVGFTANNNMQIPDFGFLPGWVAPNAVDQATEPSILGSSGFVPDNYEILVHTDAQCSAKDNQEGCSVVTPGAVAHHGWAGDRIVIAEYKMPQSTCDSNCANKHTGSTKNTNLPAWWSLPSTTINIAQYGFSFDPSNLCTGWSTGSGELDIHEILPSTSSDEPSTIGYAAMHMNGHYSGTPPQGFPRPDGEASMKMAVVMSGDGFRIQVLDEGFEFGNSIDESMVEVWLAGKGSAQDGAFVSGNKVGGASSGYAVDVESVGFDVILG